MIGLNSPAQIVKEWYFFNGYNSETANVYNAQGDAILSHDSLLFGWIKEPSDNGVFYAFKATHRQGLVLKKKFGWLTNNYALDMCIDTTNQFLYYLAKTHSRPPLQKYTQAIIYKVTYDLNVLDSVIVSYGTIFEGTRILLHNSKLYVCGRHANFFSEPLRVVVGSYDANTLNEINIQQVTGFDNSRGPVNMSLNSKQQICLFLTQHGNNTGPLNYGQLVIDTNLVKVDSFSVLNKWFVSTYLSVKDYNGYTFCANGNVFNPTPPYNTVYNYWIKTNEKGDTIKTTFYSKGSIDNNNQINRYGISNIFKLPANRYLGLGMEYYGNPDPNNLMRFFEIDSNLNIINQIPAYKNTTAQILGQVRIGRTTNRTYYLSASVKDTTNVNLYVYYLMTIDSTAALQPPPEPTVTPTPPIKEWDDITVYPNPTDDLINFGLPTGSTYNLSIYNNLGQSIFNINDLNSNRQISLANLPEGVYHFVFYETELKKRVSKKVVVKR